MMSIYIYKINLKESKIPNTLKLPEYVYPQFPKNKKPNTFLQSKIDIKKTEFLLKVEKGKEHYSFERLDPFPQIWTRGGINLFRDKKFKDLFSTEEEDSFFFEKQAYNVSKISYDETDKSLINNTFHYAGKKNKKLKLYDKTLVQFDFIKEVKSDDAIDAFPLKVQKNLNLKNLKKSYEILKKKAVVSKEFFSKRLFAYQHTSKSYDLYDVQIIAKKLQELKFYVLPKNESDVDKKNFFSFFNQYYLLSQRILGYDKDKVEILRDIIHYLSFDKVKKQYSKNLIFYMDLLDEYWKSKN